MHPLRLSPKKLPLLAVLLLAVCMFAAVARAEVQQALPRIEQLFFPSPLDFALSFEENDTDPMDVDNLLGPSIPPAPRQQFLTLLSSLTEKELKGLAHFLSADRHMLWTFLATSPRFKGALHGEGMWVYSPPDPGPVKSYGDVRPQLLRLRFNRQRGRFDYGAEYRYIAKDFELPANTDVKRDQAGIEIWGAQKFGVATVRTSLSDFWNNVDSDPHRVRLTAIEGKIALDLALPSWPLLRFSYARGSARRSRQSDGFQSAPYWIETIGASIYHGNSSWEITLSSTYSPITDSLEAEPRTIAFNHELSLAYHPTDLLTIAPTLSFYEERAHLSDTRLLTPSASLVLTQNQLFDLVDLTLYGSYAKAISNDGLVDNGTIDATMSLVWNLKKTPLGKASLSFEVAYFRYLDTVYRESSAEELTGKLLLKIVAL